MDKILASLIVGVGAVIVFLVMLVVLSALYAIPTYFLWNWLMPILTHFAVAPITWFQAWGVNMLSGILFKSSSTSKKKE